MERCGVVVSGFHLGDGLHRGAGFGTRGEWRGDHGATPSDAFAASLVEAAHLLAPVSVSDAAVVVLAELAAISATVSALEDAAIRLSEVADVEITDAEGVVDITVTDAVAIILGESAFISVTAFAADALTVALEERATADLLFEATEAIVVALTEAATVVASTPPDVVPEPSVLPVTYQGTVLYGAPVELPRIREWDIQPRLRPEPKVTLIASVRWERLGAGLTERASVEVTEYRAPVFVPVLEPWWPPVPVAPVEIAPVGVAERAAVYVRDMELEDLLMTMYGIDAWAEGYDAADVAKLLVLL